MRKSFLALLLLCALLATASFAAAEENQNLVKNGGFEQVSGSMPTEWFRGMWVTDWGVSVFELSEDAYEGQYSALLRNQSANDARYEQTLQVKPQTIYRFSAMVKAEGCDPDLKGANLSVADIYDTSPDVHDTEGEWQELVFYGRTGQGQKEITLMARVGGYGSENVGTAQFDNITAVQVEEVPQGAAYLELLPASRSAASDEGESGGPGWMTPVSLLLSALFYVLVAYLLSRHMVANNTPMPLTDQRGNPLLWGVLLLLFLLRVLVAVLVPGYGVDMNCFYGWSARMVEMGPGGFYAPDYFCDYPPGYLYVLWGVGWLIRLTGLPTGHPVSQILIKLVPIAADMLTAFVLYTLAKAAMNKRAATGLALLYALNPATFVVGAAWGQIDAVLAILLLLVLMFAERGQWHFVIPLYVVTVLIKPQALMLGPVGLAVLIQDLTRRRKDKKAWIEFAIGAGAGILLLLLLPLPFLGEQQPLWLIDKYKETMASYDKATVNGANLFYLMNGNWENINSPAVLGLSWNVLGMALLGLWLAFVIFLAVWKNGRERLYELGALLFLGLFCLTAMMHERYIFPVIVFALMAFVRSRDRRWLWIFLLVTLAAVMNCGMVLAFQHLTHPYVWLGKAVAVLYLLTLVLTTWTVVDHVFLDRYLPLPPFTPRPIPASGDSLSRAQRALQTAPDGKLHLSRWDWALMLFITALYAVVAFWGLGDTKAPQTYWRAGTEGAQVVFDLGEEQEVRMLYYSAISHDTFTVETSLDNESWTAPTRAQDSDCFRWMEFSDPLVDAEGEYLYNDKDEIRYNSQTAELFGRYVRITSLGGRLVLGEVGFRTPEDAKIPVVAVQTEAEMTGDSNPRRLADEQGTVPVHPSYMNGTYFDEIYHARTAYEHLHGLAPYESSHPPLGKLIMSLGIALFGMTPFGWRFMGALMGVLMVAVMYLLGKQLLKRTRWASLMAILMALDMMHLTQTRIATIDSYAVLFIMLMYLCMFRYVQMSFYHQKLWRTLVPLGLSGLFMGLAIASKWIGIYAAVGIAVLFFYTLYCRWEEYRICADYEQQEEGPQRTRMMQVRQSFWPNALITLGCCVVFFLIVPAGIYCLSYVPYLSPTGPVTLGRIWSIQVNQMFGYHSGLVDDHAFKSPWYSWPFIGKPMWYYNNAYKPAGTASTILAFGNPAVWWVGLVALLLVAGMQCFRLYARIFDEPSARIERLHHTTLTPPAMVLIGFLSNYLPWVLVPRSMFIYHYFASLPFVILCIGLVFRWLDERYPRRTKVAYAAYVLLALGLFIAFYPMGTGMVVSRSWAETMNWFRGWLYF